MKKSERISMVGLGIGAGVGIILWFVMGGIWVPLIGGVLVAGVIIQTMQKNAANAAIIDRPDQG